MRDRPLTEQERELWQRLIETVDPMPERRKLVTKASLKPPEPARPLPPAPPKNKSARSRPASTKPISSPPRSVPLNPGQLDGHWDRRMTKGRLEPDVTLDLHGQTIATAYARLDAALELALASGHRVMLLIAGRARTYDRAKGHGRGAIRAALDDWLTASRHASRIAAVCPAHPRHGGSGAVYIILKRIR